MPLTTPVTLNDALHAAGIPDLYDLADTKSVTLQKLKDLCRRLGISPRDDQDKRRRNTFLGLLGLPLEPVIEERKGRKPKKGKKAAAKPKPKTGKKVAAQPKPKTGKKAAAKPKAPKKNPVTIKELRVLCKSLGIVVKGDKRRSKTYLRALEANGYSLGTVVHRVKFVDFPDTKHQSNDAPGFDSDTETGLVPELPPLDSKSGRGMEYKDNGKPKKKTHHQRQRKSRKSDKYTKVPDLFDTYVHPEILASISEGGSGTMPSTTGDSFYPY